MWSLLQKILSVMWASMHGPKSMKAIRELSYWKWCKAEQGILSSDHYEYFYTTHYGLDKAFYKNKKILDIGCGPNGSLEWADMAAERVGLDPLIDSYRKLGIDNHKMQYVTAQSEQIPFPDDYFDVVCSFNSLDHIDNIDKTISEIIRVIVPGGLFLLLTELHPSPTIAEPIVFSWDIVNKFVPHLKVVEEKHYEDKYLNNKPSGVYTSVMENISYDHNNPKSRYGVLSAKFKKVDRNDK